MKKLSVVVAVVLSLLVVPAGAEAKCQTHKCWHRVHMNRVANSVVKKIARITPYHCYGGRWAVPCSIIGTESKGSWTAVNTEGSGAIGPYQFLGWPVPWPVIVRSHYQTLKNELAHHRMARTLWGQQTAGVACHWCY